MNIRNLAVEACGDRWKKKIKPEIRLMGKWLQKAGFQPGSWVLVVLIADRMIELRAQPPKPET